MDTYGQFQLHPLLLSFMVAVCALVLTAPPAVLLALFTSSHRFFGQDVLEAALLLPLVMPPVMTGLMLLLALGAHSPLGVFHWLFTPWAAVLASSIVGFPLMYQSARAAFLRRDTHLEDAARSLGATRSRVLGSITLRLAWPGLAAGALLAFARALGEFGATVMVAGNVPGKTLTAPVAIYFATEDGHLLLAARYALVLAAVNMLFLMMLTRYFRSDRL